ncbi:unnamed protein product [Musa hybrid cultivar]
MSAAAAMTGKAGPGGCHGLRSGSGISGTSMATPLSSSTRRSTELRDRNRSVSSATRTLSMSFSVSSRSWCWVSSSTCITIRPFSLPSWATWFVRSSSCRCFLIRDLLADSRFDSFRLCFLSSAVSLASPSDHEPWRLRAGDIPPISFDEQGTGFGDDSAAKMRPLSRTERTKIRIWFRRRHKTSRGTPRKRIAGSRLGGDERWRS